MAEPVINCPASAYSRRVHCGIYLITVDRSAYGKLPAFYIGQSFRMHKRLAGHWAALKRGNHGNPVLQRTWEKYGELAFSKSVLIEGVPYDMLTDLEQAYLDDFRITFGDERILNIMVEAVDSRLGTTHTEEVRKCLSEKQKQNWENDEYRNSILVSIRAAGQRPETKKNRSIAAKVRFADPAEVEVLRLRGIAMGLNTEISERRKATNAKPEIKAKRRASALRAHEEDPGLRVRIAASGKIAQNLPEVKNRIAATNALPETKARRSASSKKAQASVEARQKQREVQLIAQNRPEQKKKKGDTVRTALSLPESKVKRAATNALPEVRLRRSIAAKARESRRAAEREAHANN